MHEIITLQLGQQSNYLATQFWNAQVCDPCDSSWGGCQPATPKVHSEGSLLTLN